MYSEMLDISSVKAAAASLIKMYKKADRSGISVAPSEIFDKAKLIKYQLATGAHNEPLFDMKKSTASLAEEIVSDSNNNSSLIIRSAIKVSSQQVEAVEIIEKMTVIMNAQAVKFNNTADSIVKEAKAKVSQLNDYTHRLSTSLDNLNKVLGNENMRVAIENADRIATALTLLDALESNGKLKKILAAINN